jgi:signal transduction histidine kinase
MQNFTNLLFSQDGKEKIADRIGYAGFPGTGGNMELTSDLLVSAAYLAIPAIFLFFIDRKKQNTFQHIFWVFTIFILGCGFTHFTETVMQWWPEFRFNAITKFITAATSWFAVLSLIYLLRKYLAQKTPEEYIKEINERDKAQEQLDKKNAELLALTKKLRVQNKQLEDFAHITSHNLRSHNTNLLSLLNLYAAEKKKEEKEIIFSKFVTTVDRLGETLEQLVESTKIRADAGIEKEEINFQEIFNKAKETLEGQIIEMGAEIKADFEKASSIQYNKIYLESIVLNLLSNALKYSSPKRKPKVTLETKIEDGRTMLVVKDNGLGIDMEMHGHKVFGLHKTFHEHKAAKGLGLFMTKAQIEALGGEISLQSEVDKGTEFRILF